MLTRNSSDGSRLGNLKSEREVSFRAYSRGILASINLLEHRSLTSTFGMTNFSMQIAKNKLQRKRSWWAIQQHASPYLFIAPFVVQFAIFTVYPLIRSIALS